MDRYADGDASAVGEVYDRMAPRLRTFFLRRTGDCGAADDLVQETFVRMHLARESFVRGADVVPWAFAIARRLLIDRRRLDQKNARLEEISRVAAAIDGTVHGHRAAHAENVALTREAASCVAAALAELPDSHREAYELLRHDELSVAQIAATLGASESAIKVRVHRVYKALDALLSSMGWETGRRR